MQYEVGELESTSCFADYELVNMLRTADGLARAALTEVLRLRATIHEMVRRANDEAAQQATR